MAKPEVLSRVDADLRRGHHRLAAQRLASLLAADPQDLDVRARLAEVYRRAGNVPEAGRWGFLTEDAEPHETAAFAGKHRRATDRLRLLRLRGEAPRSLGPLAAARYAELAARAAAEAGPPADPEDTGPAARSGPLLPRPGAVPAVRHTVPEPVRPTSDLGWSGSDILTALLVFGPVVVVAGVILYEIAVALYGFLSA